MYTGLENAGYRLLCSFFGDIITCFLFLAFTNSKKLCYDKQAYDTI